MSSLEESKFDAEFDQSPSERSAMLDEARQSIRAASSTLGERGLESAGVDPAAQLLEDLDDEVAHFSPELEVLELLEEHFSQHGLAVPIRFKDESRENRFFWVRFPLMLMPASQKPFVRLKCAVQFNPGNERRRPSTQLILPDRRFVELLHANTGLTLSINESFDFSASLPSMGIKPPPIPPVSVKPPQTPPAPAPKPTPAPVAPGIGPGGLPVPIPGSPVTAAGSLAADVQAAATLGVVAGPFIYKIKKAKLNHGQAGSPDIWWEFTDTEYLREEDPNLVVVLKVPREVDRVEIAGALKADHGYDFLSADLGLVLGLLADRIKEFLLGGAPITDKKTWNITDRTIRA